MWVNTMKTFHFAPKESAGTEAINLFLAKTNLKIIPLEIYNEMGEDYTSGEFDLILS